MNPTLESHKTEYQRGRQPRGATGASSIESLSPIIGESAPLRRALQRLRRFAAHAHVTLLLEGETGTGKTLFARHAHLVSPRARGTFHEVSLAALDDGLASSALFGHVRGAFTDAREKRSGYFISADSGTLFLDEIGKASLAVQKKLLGVIESGEVWPVGADRATRVNVRVITATNDSLEELAKRGQFLPDLLARLGYFRIRLPALRERRADIPRLVEHAMGRHARACGFDCPPMVHPSLMEALRKADWPRNVRQLDAVVQRLLVEAAGERIVTLSHCRDDLAYLRSLAGGSKRGRPPVTTREQALRAVEQSASLEEAAELLSVSRSTLYRHLGIHRTEPPSGGDVASD